MPGVLQALRADVTANADLLGLTRGPALLGEEGLRVRLSAQGTLLPRQATLLLDERIDQDEIVHWLLLDP